MGSNVARRRLTPTERAIVLLVAELGGEPCSKARMAERLGRNEKTVDRLLSGLRRDGVISAEPAFAPSGGQLANSYRVADVDALAECVHRATG
ncbi:MAG TPA: hypothetical protein IAA22_02385 [Candidatus Olsenella stercoravium]|uniref:MarR family protein n=1 Tax=Candidatus Olsenella stercoravium TaxID=2838713 RepID=A0A9D2DJ07_9ACTN|nr:hypothetical protein [Candidatus Olsenella stercoravium]